jgi:hypothetical protein
VSVVAQFKNGTYRRWDAATKWTLAAPPSTWMTLSNASTVVAFVQANEILYIETEGAGNSNIASRSPKATS